MMTAALSRSSTWCWCYLKTSFPVGNPIAGCHQRAGHYRSADQATCVSATSAHRTGHILAFRTCLKASRYDIVLALRCEATLMHSWRLTDYSCHSERNSSGNSEGVSAGEVTPWNQRFSEKLALSSKQ
jgi:hypothetical protein